jgi:hypothetical protein
MKLRGLGAIDSLLVKAMFACFLAIRSANFNPARVRTVRPEGQKLLLIQSLPGAETPGSPGSYRAAKDPEFQTKLMLESGVAFSPEVYYLILLVKLFEVGGLRATFDPSHAWG